MNQNPDFQPSPKPKGDPSKMVIYFVPLGIDMTKKDISVFRKNAIKFGAKVLLNFPSRKKRSCQTPNVLCISQYCRPAQVAKRLKFKSTEEFQEFLYKNNIVCVKREWMVRCFYDQNEFKISPSTEFLHTDIPSFDFLKRKRSSTKEAIKSLDASQKGDDSDIDDMESCKRGSRNKEMSKAFLDLSKLYQQCSLDRFDTWKAYSFAVISGRLRHLDFEIATLDDCKKLAVIPGFGPSTREMVKQFLVTGEIQRTKALLASEERQAMIALTNIWGVGMATAKQLTKHGCKNIEDIRSKLKTGEIRLDRNQKIGVDCYEDFQEKMHRDEVEKIGEIVYGAARDYLSSQETEKDKLRISIMGSYRRGKQTCGDVDVLITHTDFDDEVPATFLGGVVEKLMKAGHITHHLTYICGMDKGGYNREWGMPPKEKGLKTSCSSWMGVFGSPLYPGKRRRVDIKFYPHRERVFAELYFTGSGHFNRSMRLYADRKKGLKLTDKGLFYRDKYSTRVTDLDPKNEKEVFEYLGLKWTPPHERDCFDAVVADNGEYVDMSEESSSFRDYEDEDEKWIE